MTLSCLARLPRPTFARATSTATGIPGWVRVDDWLGEDGIGADTAEACHEFEGGSSRRSCGGGDGRVRIWQSGARAMQEVGVGEAFETGLRRADPGYAEARTALAAQAGDDTDDRVDRGAAQDGTRQSQAESGRVQRPGSRNSNARGRWEVGSDAKQDNVITPHTHTDVIATASPTTHVALSQAAFSDLMRAVQGAGVLDAATKELTNLLQPCRGEPLCAVLRRALSEGAGDGLTASQLDEAA